MTSSTLQSALASNDPNLNRTSSYSYDSFNQLTGKTVSDRQGHILEKGTFQYDGNNNLLVRVAGGVTRT